MLAGKEYEGEGGEAGQHDNEEGGAENKSEECTQRQRMDDIDDFCKSRTDGRQDDRVP